MVNYWVLKLMHHIWPDQYPKVFSEWKTDKSAFFYYNGHVNPFENQSGELRVLHKRGSRTLDNLKQARKEEWSKIPFLASW